MLSKEILGDLSADAGKFDRDFCKVTKIARGGFSSVYKATHKVDQQDYAIKKIVLRANTGCTQDLKESLLQMLKEVRLFAAINDPHVVRYNHSWLEVTEQDKEEEPTVKDEELASCGHIDPELELQSPFIDFACPETHSPAEHLEGSHNLSQSRKTLKIALYIQMELCKQTLEEKLEELNAEHGRVDDAAGYEKRLRIARQIIDALATVHQAHRLIHRDLSLRNVFIGKSGIVKVGDFGLATRCQSLIPMRSSPLSLKPEIVAADGCSDEFCLDEEEEDFDSSVVEESESEDELSYGMGTRLFASPEQMSGSSYDQKADIYSLGLVLMALFYPAATKSEQWAVLRNARKDQFPEGFTSTYPDLARLIRKMLSTNPTERPTILDIISQSSAFLLPLANPIKPSPRSRPDPLTNVSSLAAAKISTRLGLAGKWKARYLRLFRGKLFVFMHKEDEKARHCYALQECTVKRLKGDAGEGLSRSDLVDPKEQEEEVGRQEDVVRVEHRELETLFFRVEGVEHERLLGEIEAAVRTDLCHPSQAAISAHID